MSTTSKKVFIDTSIFIAFIDRANLNHQKSTQVIEFFAKQGYQLFTSNLVVVQTFNRIEKEIGTSISLDFLQAILESDIEVIYYDQQDLIACFRFLKNYQSKQASLNEIINSHLMNKRSIPSVITYDLWHNLMGTQVSSLILGDH